MKRKEGRREGGTELESILRLSWHLLLFHPTGRPEVWHALSKASRMLEEQEEEEEEEEGREEGGQEGGGKKRKKEEEEQQAMRKRRRRSKRQLLREGRVGRGGGGGRGEGGRGRGGGGGQEVDGSRWVDCARRAFFRK